MQLSRLLHAHELVMQEARTMARQAAEAGDDGTNVQRTVAPYTRFLKSIRVWMR